MKYWQIPNTQYPTWAIDLSKLDDFTEITKIMLELGMIKYTYSFTYQGQVIKYGISADFSRVFGERVYRQAGHLDGWDRKLQGSSGSDMRIINDDYYAETGHRLNRIGMILTVINLSDAENPNPSDRAWVCKKLEREFIKEHIARTGKPPIGNKDEETKIDNKSYVSKETISNLFDGLLDA